MTHDSSIINEWSSSAPTAGTVVYVMRSGVDHIQYMVIMLLTLLVQVQFLGMQISFWQFLFAPRRQQSLGHFDSKKSF